MDWKLYFHSVYLFPPLTPKSKSHFWMNFHWTYPKMYNKTLGTRVGGILYYVHPSFLPPSYWRMCIPVKDAVPSLKASETVDIVHDEFPIQAWIPFSYAPMLWYNSKLISVQSLAQREKKKTPCPHRANTSHIQFAIIQIYTRNVVRAKKNSHDWLNILKQTSSTKDKIVTSVLTGTALFRSFSSTESQPGRSLLTCVV